MDAFSHHEALDRAYLVGDIFQRLLTDHTFIKAHPDLATRCDEIATALGDLYQAIGSLDPEPIRPEPIQGLIKQAKEK